MDNKPNKDTIREGFNIEDGKMPIKVNYSLIHNKGIAMIFQKITFIGLIVGLLVVFPNGVGVTQAQDTTEATHQHDAEKLRPVGKVTHQISGLLVYLFPRGEPTQITIAHDTDNMDHVFKIDGNTEIIGKKDVKKFIMGDRVKIIYEEETSMKEDGKQLTERTAKEIKFMAPAIKGLRSQ